MLKKEEKLILANEIFARRKARIHLSNYIKYTTPSYKSSAFSESVCDALDKFFMDMDNGKRPILVLQAPPQHGKSEIVSRCLPAFAFGKNPNLKIACASYSDALAGTMAQDVRRKITSDEHLALFPHAKEKKKYDVNRIGEFNAPGGKGTYIGVGVGAGLTGRPADLGIIDDPTKNQQEALSQTTKENHWNWYQTVFTSRMSENSGQIIMATQWAEDDLPGRVCAKFLDDPRLKVLRFPAINSIDEVGYNPDLPLGALVPELHSLEKLLETKALFSDFWWAAMYQQSAKPLKGNVFKEDGIQYYLPKDLPEKFDIVVASWDCTFKDTDGADFVVGQVWGKRGANSYLLDQVRERMSFTATIQSVAMLKNKWPEIREILIEDKANGPAVIDTLKATISGIIPIEPDGSKLARAHAVTSYWEAKNIYIPAPEFKPWVKQFISELTSFPASANDDQVDSLTQALRRLYPLRGKINISADLLAFTSKKGW